MNTRTAEERLPICFLFAICCTSFDGVVRFRRAILCKPIQKASSSEMLVFHLPNVTVCRLMMVFMAGIVRNVIVIRVATVSRVYQMLSIAHRAINQNVRHI